MIKLLRNKQYSNAGYKFWHIIRFQLLAWVLFIIYEFIVATSIDVFPFDQSISLLRFKVTCFFIFSIGFTFIVKYLDPSIYQSRNEEDLNSSIQHQPSNSDNQVNPHFLFNTLSYIYNKIFRIAPEGAEAVLGLSQILRYSTNNRHKKDKTLLIDELNQVELIIRLNHLRQEREGTVLIETVGDISQTKIPSYILVKFVENMFKYGSLSEHNQGYIRITLEDSILKISSINKSRKATLSEKNGSGLKNIRKKLQFHYHDKMRFEYEDKNGVFELRLQINQ